MIARRSTMFIAAEAERLAQQQAAVSLIGRAAYLSATRP